MTKAYSSLILSIFLFTSSYASTPPPDSLFLRVIVPESDTSLTGSSRMRISASTLPTGKATINGKDVKVYGSGAFCGVVNVPVGPSVLRLVVRNTAGDSIARNFFIQRAEPPKTSPSDPIVIDSVMMEPSQNLWLAEGDILEVKFKGSPGRKPTFDIEGVESGIPMTELSPASAGGLGGVYIGRYKVKEQDEARDVPITFRIRKNFFSSEKAISKGKVSILPKELPRVAELTGRRPYVNAGLGADRLGGAKLGFLQSGVRVVVTGKVGEQYRIRLGDEMEAWIPDDFCRLLPLETPQPHSLVGTLGVSGNDKEDIVTVSLDQRLPYLSQQTVNPSQIVVDIFGATSNTNWITQQLSGRGVKSVTWNQVAADQYRLTVSLAYQQHWGYDITYENNATLRIAIRRPPVVVSADSLLKGFTIAIDAGHGGDNVGAYGSTGVMEKYITFSVIQHLDSLLKTKGVNVVLTRTTDETVSMAVRTERVITSGAQILVSVHSNSIGNTSDPELTKGTSAYYRYIGFQPLANIMYGKMLELGLDQFGLVGSFNFSLNAPTQLPNALVETAFLSNPEDEMLLLDDNFRSRIASQIVKGLEVFVATYGERK